MKYFMQQYIPAVYTKLISNITDFKKAKTSMSLNSKIKHVENLSPDYFVLIKKLFN